MLIIDSNKTASRRLREAVERTRQISRDAAEAEARAAPLVEDRRTSVANEDRQYGGKLTATAFMNKLHQIDPNFILEPHPNRDRYPFLRNSACLYLRLPDQTKEFLMPCEGDIMPEWSILATLTVRVPDGPNGCMWREKKIPGPEIKRGWRTILLRLIRRGLLPVAKVDAVFGPCDRQTWKVLTGKGSGELLI